MVPMRAFYRNVLGMSNATMLNPASSLSISLSLQVFALRNAC
jgi:hypothetical protein